MLARHIDLLELVKNLLSHYCETNNHIKFTHCVRSNLAVAWPLI